MAKRKAVKSEMSVGEASCRLLLHAVQVGAASFDPETRELRFNGLRYSARDRDWFRLASLIGFDTLAMATVEKEVS